MARITHKLKHGHIPAITRLKSAKVKMSVVRLVGYIGLWQNLLVFALKLLQIMYIDNKIKSFQRLHERLELPLDCEHGTDHIPAVQPPAPLHTLRGFH